METTQTAFKTATTTLFLVIAFTLATVPAAGAGPSDAAYYIIGLRADPDQRPGDRFHGAYVVSVNQAIGFISVQTKNPQGFEARAANDPNVRYIAEDRPDAVYAFFVPNDPHQDKQWAWGSTKGAIDAYAAWDITRGSTAVTVAVLDTGLDKSHEDIGNYLPGYDFVNNDNDPDDRCDHGTHVAGTVGAITNNGVGVAGTAQTTILPVKVLDKWRWTCSGSFSAIANGITYAAQKGADVISMSLGCDQPCSNQAVSDALAYAASMNVLAVCAAGNSGGGAVGFPASDSNCMAVSALDPDGGFASYSSKGSAVEIAAPGTDIASTIPGDKYAYMSGTSMATPHVAGVAALVLSVNASLDGAALRDHLKATAVNIGLPANQQGSGALNAYDAVRALGSPPLSSAPSASFTETCTDLTCSFTDTSTDGDGFIASWSWAFGDGNASAAQHPSHTYSAAATYTVSLTVTDDDGATDTASHTVTVSAPTTNNPPSAAFAETCTDLTCAFTDTSTDDGTIVAWSWDFGDGNTSTTQNPGHTYAAGGTYTVGLTVTDDDGATGTTSHGVTVSSSGAGSVGGIHVADLDDSGSSGQGGSWTATVTVTVHDTKHTAEGGSTVSFEYLGSKGTSGSLSCTTGSGGTCTVSVTLHNRESPATFTVTGISDADGSYDASSNHDPDTDSDGTSITVAKVN